MTGRSGVVGSLLLLIAIATYAEAGRGTCRNFQCPKENGYFAHPKTCLSYVKCVRGRAFEKHCPANLHYNPETQMCDLAAKSNCVESVKERSTSCRLHSSSRVKGRSAELQPVPGIQCDCGECCRKPNPDDCKSFYECDENGNAFAKTCSEPLVYNPLIEDCDLDVNYQCPEVPKCECKCRYPVEGECDAFFKCDDVNGTRYKEYCTEGLLFNPDKEMCDLSSNVDCPPVDPTVSPTDCKDLKTDCKYWVANGDCVCDPHKNGDCSWQHYVQRNCPASCTKCNTVDATTVKPPPVIGCTIDCSGSQQYWPHPSDCTKFIQCAPYGPQEMPCPQGTRWDQSILTCNHAASTPCVTGNYQDADGKACGGNVAETTVVVPTAGGTTEEIDNSGDCKDLQNDCKYWAANGDCVCDPSKSGDCFWQNYVQNNCRASCNKCGGGNEVVTSGPGGSVGCEVDCSKGQYHRHPTNCEMFIQCTPYGPQEMPCAPGTRWDQDILTCNHASQTPCITGEGDCVSVVTTPTSPDCDSLSCPQPNGEFPHPRDCSKWVHCSNSYPHVKDCPANLHFDPIKRVCSWPQDTTCYTSDSTDCQIPVQPTPPPECTSTDGCIVPEVCDCECCLRPHPEDCESYYYCDGENSQFFTCSEGLVFSPMNQTCVYPEDYPACVPDPPPECECECLYPSSICTEYYKCENDVPVKKECPNGLYYNDNKKSCDHKENVQCEMPSKRSSLMRASHHSYITAEKCKALPDGLYAAKDPHAFYSCIEGIGFMLKCQKGLTFNAQLSKCVRM